MAKIKRFLQTLGYFMLKHFSLVKFIIPIFLCLGFCNFALAANPSIISSKTSKAADDEVVDRYKEENPWGMSVSIDLHECNDKLIRDGEYIKKFLKDLVAYLKMKAYGEPVVVDFGDNPRVSGFSAMQLIQTSSITAHFANFTNSVHIDIFSCKWYRPHEAALFCKQYFQAKELTVSPVVFRF